MASVHTFLKIFNSAAKILHNRKINEYRKHYSLAQYFLNKISQILVRET